MSETNAMSLFDRCTDPLAAIEKMGTFLAKSGMFGCEKVEQGMVIALACLVERRSPIDIMKKYHIISGQLSMRADAMLAEFRAKGGKVRWEKTGDDGKEATGVFVFEDQEIPVTFTFEQAKKAGYVKAGSGWMKTPGAMMRARVISSGIRMLAPECVSGTYTPEEVESFDPKNLKDATPEPETPAAPKTEAPAPKPAAAKKPEPPAEPKKEKPAEAPAPTAEKKAEPPKEEPKPEPKPSAPAPAPAGEAQEAVSIIAKEAGIEANAIAWLIGNGFIKEGGTFADLSREDAERLASKPNTFIRYVQNGQVAKPLVPAK